MIETLITLDKQLFFLINQAGNEFWDPIMLFISYKFSWIPLYAFLIYSIIKQKESIWIIVLIIALITIVDQSSVHLFKNTFQRLRPCYFLNDVRLVLIDGVDLAKLMIEYCVGVQVKENITVAKIDQDFFSGED